MGIANWLNNNISLHEHDSRKDEFYNSLSHFIGAIASLIATFFLTKRGFSIDRGHGWGALVFGFSMILSYGSSSIYHGLQKSALKRFFRMMDHFNIYILIAGTYTPLCIAFYGEGGRTLLILIWIFAALGTLFTLVFWGRLKPLHIVIYLVMGWLIVFYRGPLKEILNKEALLWILGGGLSYTIGVIFYGSKKIPHYHAIWHLFVMGGSFFFFKAIYSFVLLA